MAKKFVRGITDVKTINNQDFDTNNVNDLLSDGQYNYIHRKKGKNEEYHNLTDNIKTLSSDNTELLSVTNNNKTTNTATLHPKHDAQKEQVLESTRNTISIHHGTNGTAEKTTVDTNPLKVLEHENLISDSEYITLDHQTDVNKTHIKTESLKQELQQLHQTKQDVLTAGTGITIQGNTISATEDINALLAQKQDKLTAGNGIIIDGHTISTIATLNITFYTGEDFRAYREVFTNPSVTFETFTFDCDPAFSERVLTANIKEKLKKYVRAGMTVSNGAISISNDGTNIKLINSAGSQNVHQQGTFTFSDLNPTGGGGV